MRLKTVRYWWNKGQRRCAYCCRQLHFKSINTPVTCSVEHIIPRSQGGTHNLRNTLCVCRRCNSLRSNKDFVEFVVGNNLPRREWLLSKYQEAKDFYSKKGY